MLSLKNLPTSSMPASRSRREDRQAGISLFQKEKASRIFKHGHKRILKEYFFTCLIFFFITFSSFAQSDSECEQALTQAQDEFDAGHFYGIPAILKDCLSKFSTEQSVRAYLLLAQSYLLIDDPISAEDSYMKLLTADPEYVADVSKDPIDIFYLSKKFTTTPVFTPHFRGGVNGSIYRLIHPVNTFSEPVNIQHSVKLTFQIGGGIDWNINENFSLCSELTYSRKAFTINYSGIFKQDNLSYTEKQNWFDIPLYLKYSDSEGKIRPFGYAGYALNILFGPKAGLIYTNISPVANEGQLPTSDVDVKLGYKREALNRSFVVGGGFRYKVGKNFAFADVRYMLGLTNLTKVGTNFYESKALSGNEYTVEDTATRYAFIGDYFRLDNVSISFGYVMPIYHPSRVKKVRTAKTMRKISKEKKK